MRKLSLPIFGLTLSAAIASLSGTVYALENQYSGESYILAANTNGSTAKNVIPDAAITTTIKSRYMADKDIKAFNIHVETVNGYVTLTGNVPSAKAAEDAIKIAETTDGVKGVTSKLRIK